MNFITSIIAVYLLVSCSVYNCEQVSKVPWLSGMKMAEVVDKLGKPSLEDTFLMEEKDDEFRIELQNTFPLTKPENRKIIIKELWWKRGDCNITLWFYLKDKHWVVFETCLWHKDMEF